MREDEGASIVHEQVLGQALKVKEGALQGGQPVVTALMFEGVDDHSTREAKRHDSQMNLANLTGDGDGDDEVIKVDLERLDPNVETIVFFVNSYQGQTFNEVDNAFCRVLDDDTQAELCRFTLTDQGAHTGVVMAVMSRNGGDWQLKAIGMPGVGRTADQLVPDALRHI